MSLAASMDEMGRGARRGALILAAASAEQRSAAIAGAAREMTARTDAILAANAADVVDATALTDRLRLDPARLEEIATSLGVMAAMRDVIGETMVRWTRPNGLDISRVRTPIGVIGMIYESRPNVTADAAAICLRSANALILRPGSDALRTCCAIHEAIVAGLSEAGLPPECVQIVPTADREAVRMMLGGLGGSIDLIIPRGGAGLVERVNREARVATLGHLEGICHSYVHASANPDMAIQIVVNAKMRRTSVCGATETVLIDREIAPSLLPRLAEALAGCELRGDPESRRYAAMEPADEADWGREYLAPVLAVKTVSGLDAAIEHIRCHGSGHTDAIICEDGSAAETFLNRVDSAIVMWNASTQFADGGEFGFGAEIGIATGRLHARGPVGAEQLTSFKYQVRGAGQARP